MKLAIVTILATLVYGDEETEINMTPEGLPWTGQSKYNIQLIYIYIFKAIKLKALGH